MVHLSIKLESVIAMEMINGSTGLPVNRAPKAINILTLL